MYINWLEALGEEILIGFAFLTIEWEILYANKIFCDLFDLTDTVGKNLNDLKILEINNTFSSNNKPISRVITAKEKRYLLTVKKIQAKELTNFMICLFPVANDLIRNTYQQYTKLKSKLDNYEKFHESTAKYYLDNIIGISPWIIQLKEKISKVSQFDSSVLILGETGTGKELVAHAIHSTSLRNKKPFIVINCAAIPDDLLEAELFGYEEGSFTGAQRGGKIGKFEAADGGTVFLDEIGELSPYLQAKLLRLLQEKEVQRVGSHEIKEIDVRIIAATNQDLGLLIEKGKFREDLFYRIQVVPIILQPLRSRRVDIPLLAEYQLNRLNRKYLMEKRISGDAYEFLAELDWPGNVRQLLNTIELAFVLYSDEITAAEFKMVVNNYKIARKNVPSDLPSQVEHLERELIIDALNQTENNKIKAAEILGINRTTLYQKLKKYGLF